MEKKSDKKFEGMLKDPRFAHLVSDPRFKTLPETERKVKIDTRFKSMFDNEKFRVKYSVDKYGRRINKSNSEDLKRFYDLNSSDEDEDAEKELEEKEIAKEETPAQPSALSKLNDGTVDFSRGEAPLVSESSSDEESSTDEEVFIEHVWGELDNDAPITDESTKRLAACNMDWDRIRASDILVLCSSFLPPGGSIVKVSIYPSEFGKERLAEEEVNGPPELIQKESEKNGKEVDDSDSEDEELAKEEDSDVEEGDEYHMEKLRQYQLNRLKYYFAVIECDSVATADKIYKECDGLEYESTATKLDLRFIPDDMEFDDEPKDFCNEMPDLSKYQPRLFTTTALQQAKVELTWDETSVERKEINEKLTSGKLNELSAAELKKYVAYSSNEEDDNDENPNNVNKELDIESEKNKNEDPIAKYKALLNSINEKENEKKSAKYDMVYSWSINPNNKSSKTLEKSDFDKLTPFEKILEKKRLKKKTREERVKKSKGEDSESSDDIPDDIDMNDPYFAEEFASGDFEAPKKLNKKQKAASERDKSSGDESDASESRARDLQLLLDDVTEEKGKEHFSLKKIQDAENDTKSKRKRRKQLKKSKKEIEATKIEAEDNFQVDLSDDRFKAVYESHMFNIDPTDSHFKKTKGMEAIIEEKLKKHSNSEKRMPQSSNGIETSEPKRSKKTIETSILVKGLKRKIQDAKETKIK